MPDATETNPTDPKAEDSKLNADQQSQIVDDLAAWEKAIESIPDPALREAARTKIKAYDRRFTERMTGLSKREKEIAQVLADAKEAASSKSQNMEKVQKEGAKVIDALLENSTDSNAREGLRQLREAIRQETDIDGVKKQVDELRQLLGRFVQSSQSIRVQSLNKEFKDIEGIYGAELIDKYRDTLQEKATQFPEYSLRRWLHSLADPEELEQAIRVRSSRTKQSGENHNQKPDSERPVISTTEKSTVDKYRGKTIQGQRQGFDKAILDGVRAVMAKRSSS